MKYLLLSLFVCALVSTGLSTPVVEVSSIGDNERVVIYDGFQSDKNLIQVAEDDKTDDEKTTLEKLREKLNELVERLRRQGKTTRAEIVEKYIQVLERLLKKLENNELDKSKFYEFVKRVKALLEKYNKEHPKEDELVQIFDDEDKDDEKTTLEKLREKLNELVERLRRQGKTTRAAIVEKYIQVLERLLKKLENNELDKSKFYEFVKRVKALLEKYNKEHPKEDELVQIFDDEDKDDEKTTLEKLREKLNELVERLRRQGKTKRAEIVEKYIQILESLLKKLENNELDKSKFYEFVKRVKALLEKYNKEHPKEDDKLAKVFADNDDEDDDDDNDDLPDQDEEKENKSKLEELREKLKELQEKLKKAGKLAKARVVEHYINVLERLLKRLENHELDKSKLADFIRRVQKLLEKYLEK